MKPPRRLVVLGVSTLLVGCGAHVRPVPPPPSVSLPVAVQPFAGVPRASSVTLQIDPISVTMAQAENEAKAGEAELALGHRTAAREHFDAAIDLLLAVPGGAKSEPRLQAQFDKLL